MADLDNFFAKKDKKKVKGRKFTNQDEIAKRLEETEKKMEKEFLKEATQKYEESAASIANDVPQRIVPGGTAKQEEEEWKDFNDDSEKDLTDLKISKLQIEDDDEGFIGGSGEDGDRRENGEHRADGVWKLAERQAEPEVPSTSTFKEESSKPCGSYVPPHLRESTHMTPTKGGRRIKQAPDINSVMAFPSLSGAQEAITKGGKKGKLADDKGFESVKHGSTKVYHDTSPPKLSTSNRFDALSDNS